MLSVNKWILYNSHKSRSVPVSLLNIQTLKLTWMLWNADGTLTCHLVKIFFIVLYYILSPNFLLLLNSRHCTKWVSRRCPIQTAPRPSSAYGPHDGSFNRLQTPDTFFLHSTFEMHLTCTSWNEELYRASPLIHFLCAPLVYFYFLLHYQSVSCETCLPWLFSRISLGSSPWSSCRGFQAHLEYVCQEKHPFPIAQLELPLGTEMSNSRKTWYSWKRQQNDRRFGTCSLIGRVKVFVAF